MPQNYGWESYSATEIRLSFATLQQDLISKTRNSYCSSNCSNNCISNTFPSGHGHRYGHINSLKIFLMFECLELGYPSIIMSLDFIVADFWMVSTEIRSQSLSVLDVTPSASRYHHNYIIVMVLAFIIFILDYQLSLIEIKYIIYCNCIYYSIQV